MQKSQTHPETEMENMVFHWQFDLKSGLFTCDDELSQLLNPGKSKFTLPQLFSVFDRRRVGEIKVNFKEVIDNHSLFSTSILINITDKRFLVNLSFEHAENKTNVINGKIAFLVEFPSIDEEDELVKVLFNRASNAILITDKNLIIIKANEQLLRHSGYQHEELIGQHLSLLSSEQYTKEFYQKLWNIVDTEKFWTGELLAKNKKGEIGAHDVKMLRIELSPNNHFYMAESKKLDFSTQFLASDPLDARLNKNNLLSKEEFTQKVDEQFKLLTKNETIVTVCL
ncbi:PAS domain-containing protein [Psychromonas sp. KJ10-10]|uniref:PAS domain-containing protein n=1 Tax=Psychromonas sp. KJ10-10 TaxID=3391823 RepID=UPI0039B4CCE5